MWKIVYFCIDFIQLAMPLIIKNFNMIRAICMKKFDGKFDDETVKVYKKSSKRKNQIIFFVSLAISTSICIFRTTVGQNYIDLTYNLSIVLSVVFNSASDFLFVYHIRCLTEHLKFIRKSNCDFREEILWCIKVKRLIHLRYSSNLCLAISTYFILVIVSLYWIFMRILYGYLNNVRGG